ncbi:hypothetical protein DB43_EU00020 [Parachlamydia acanthamoebae]|uniref:Uncharacterized protein n=1 Tax=Parachlamydia acanthamoebae TaxID=83552 RepID=A0A0C1EDG1_9BACT|nr:hypothetical protein DB43_EU00020 [Parachlamydia acanthamoebae]
MGKKDLLLERFFGFKPHSFLDLQISGIGSDRKKRLLLSTFLDKGKAACQEYFFYNQKK